MIWKPERLLPFLALSVHVSCISAAIETQVISESCDEPAERKAWHTLSNEERKDYIEAELCLMKLNYTNDLLPMTTTLFQALQEQHQLQAEHIHEVGAFLPYHRYMTWAHEYFLQKECGYRGAQPYWDELQDAGKFINSSLFDPTHGFGGNGRDSDRCVVDGPFANYTLIIGPGYKNTAHCLSRDIDDLSSTASNSTWLDHCNKLDNYLQAWDCIEFFPHSGGHSGVGGEMMNPISSPGDPLFYLHHAYIDKVWWDWQNANLTSRLYDMDGPNTKPVASASPIRGRAEAGKNGDPGNTTTLEHVLSLLDVLPDKIIKDVMDTQSGFLCYEYV